MFDLLITGAQVIDVVDGHATLLGVRDVAIEAGRIAAVAPEGTIDPGQAADLFDGDELALLPGLVNAHTHAAMTLFRGAAEDLPFAPWFHTRIRPLEALLTPEDVYWGTMLAVAEMFEAGVTCFADHYFHLPQVAEAVRLSGARALLAPCIFGDEANAEASMAETRALIEAWHGAADGRIGVWVGPHSHYTCSEGLLRASASLAGEMGVGVHLHLSEEQWEVDQSLRENGARPVQVLERAGVLDVPALCAHALVLDDEEVAILGRHGAGIATCPKTYMRMGLGNTPVPALIAAGAAIGIGSDGVASNATLDLWEQQRLAGMLQKFEHHDAAVAPPAEALGWAIDGGARALGWSDRVGRVAPGYLADLVFVDTQVPHLTPSPDLVNALAGQARPGDVRHVLVNGQFVLRDGHLLTIDRDTAMIEVDVRSERIRGVLAHT